jgi:predicted TIM-barrel fold metal-dependent hydrolase
VSLEIVDTQIHVWEPNSKERPWDEAFARTRASFISFGDAITIERAVGAMEAVGVAKALVTSFHLYHDIDYALEAAERHPGRFAVVPHVDLNAPDLADLVTEYAAHPSVVAMRVSFMGKGLEYYDRLHAGAYDGLIEATKAARLPLMMLVSSNVSEAGWIARRHPDLTVIVDHLGMIQGPNRQPPEDRFSGIGDLLGLASIGNVAVKLTGAPTLSRQGYPFRDIWPNLRRIIDAFGPDRLMWGSDFTRTRPLHTYADAVSYMKYSDQVSEAERVALLGGTARRLLGWHRA